MTVDYSPNPKLETIQINVPYAVTINLSDKELSPDLTIAVETYFKQFNYLFKGFDSYVNLRPEFSPTGRLHYHGVVQFKEHAAITDLYHKLFYKQYVQKQLNLKLVEITSYPEWMAYVRKQRNHIKPYFNKLSIKYLYKKNPLNI